MSNRVTIKDVAREANVSIKTVSNVINNNGGMREETRKKVQEAIRKLDYRINTSARSLKTGATKLIGLCIFDFSQPFASYLADKVIEAARRKNYGVIICTYGINYDLSAILNETYQLGADGWIFFTNKTLREIDRILDQSYPIVLAGDYLSYGKVDWVTMPNAEAFEYITGELLDSGQRKISLVGAPSDMRNLDRIMQSEEGTPELRMQGYVNAFSKRNIPIDWNMVVPCELLNQEDGVKAVDVLLQGAQMPETILCMTDATAFGVMHQLQKHGYKIPDDIQVIGFDGVPEGKYSTPSLTSISPNVEQYSEKAVELLISRLEGYKGESRNYISNFEVINRDSAFLD